MRKTCHRKVDMFSATMHPFGSFIYVTGSYVNIWLVSLKAEGYESLKHDGLARWNY
jgi:hypothetical protein